MSIYLDNAATMPIKECALNAMNEVYRNNWYNPSGYYTGSNVAKQTLEACRNSIASMINAEAEEIIFTSGGTESDNFALWGNRLPVISNIEHHAIKKISYERLYLKCNEDGLITDKVFSDIKESLIPYCTISVMMINNEIGTIQPIEEIAEYFHKYNAVVHTDAVQAVGHYQIDVKQLGVDMLSASAHKFGGPRGVGFIYIKKDYKDIIKAMMVGGGQEFGKRPGTENLPGIAGMEAALRESVKNIDKNWIVIANLSSHMYERVKKEIDNVSLNGSLEKRYPGNLNFCFHGVRGEQLLEMLNQNDIYASSGSACNTGSDEPSHVLKAIGLSDEDANASIRFTLSENNTKEEIDKVVDVLKQSVKILRGV